MLQQPTVCQLNNGDRFEGQMLGPSSLHSGIYSYVNGDRFKGSFMNQMKHGLGVYNYAGTGEVYDG
jgi:hypothetical protein